jgi:hypothetical protein
MESKKPASHDAGFLLIRLVRIRLVADPHWPRTIIRPRNIAAVRIEVDEGG